MYRRENIDRKIVDIERLLATTDDQLVIALLNMAIESFVAERDALPPPVNRPAAKETEAAIGSASVAIDSASVASAEQKAS